jgi:hypothetical protein
MISGDPAQNPRRQFQIEEPRMTVARSHAPFVPGLIACLLLPLVTGCGDKKRSTVERAEGAEDESPVRFEDYQPLESYAVASYEVPVASFSVASPLSSQTDSIEDDTEKLDAATGASLSDLAQRPRAAGPVGALQLIDDNPVRFYTGFPIRLKFALSLAGGSADMLVNFGFIEVAPDGATDEQIAALHRCNLGSVRAADLGDAAQGGEPGATPGAQTFDASLPIPLECLKGGEPTKLMLFAAFNPDGAVQTESGEARKIIVFDRKTTEESGVCFKFHRDAVDCQNEIYLERSPGANIKLGDFSGDSSVAVLPSKDPIATITNDGRLPSPFFKGGGRLMLEGIAEDDPEIERYSARITYDLCQGDGDRSALVDDCDPAVGWQPMQVFGGELPENPSEAGRIQVVKGFEPLDAVEFSAPLHITGAVYDLLERRGTGAWKGESNFRIRACAKLYKDDQPIEQKNLDSQLVDGNPEADDCLVFPIYVVEGRADALERCQESVEGGALALSDESSCRSADGVAAPSFASGLTVDPTSAVVNPTLSFAKGWSNAWGSASKFQLRFSADPRLSLTPLRASTSLGSSMSLQGYIGVEFFDTTLVTSVDLSGSDAHYVEPSFHAFGQKIYGARQNVGNEFVFNLPVKPLGGSGQSRSIAKSRNFRIDYTNKDKPRVVSSSSAGNANALFVREICKGGRVEFAVISINFQVCAEGGLFASAGSYACVRSLNEDELASYAGGKRRAALATFFAPSVAATGNLRASVSLVVVRGGVKGSLRVISFGLPTYVQTEVRNFEKALVKNDGEASGYGMLFDTTFNSTLDINWLDGVVSAYADVRRLDWCKAWFIYYPCGFSWSRVAERAIVKFSGGGASYRLAKESMINYRADPY